MAKIPKKIAFPNKPEDEMIIGAYVEPLLAGPYVKNGLDVTLDEAFDDLKESGCNTIFQTESKLHVWGFRHNKLMFEHAAKRGLTFLPRDGALIDDNNRPIIRDYEEAHPVPRKTAFLRRPPGQNAWQPARSPACRHS